MASRRGFAVLAAIALAAAGCAGIPTSGSVHIGRVLAPPGGVDQADVRIVPHGPVAGMSPTDIVHGFLRAMVDSDGGYGIARSYLTPRTAQSWRSSGVTTYDDSNIHLVVTDHTSGTRVVELLAPRVGDIDGRGDFTPASGQLDASFTLVKQGGQWRIDRLPRGALLSAYDALRSAYRLADVYYLNHDGTTLVPEQLLLPPRGITTALVRALVEGPGEWLAPAVHTAFPRGTELVGNVPVDASGTAQVDLSSAVRQASSAQLQELSAQLVWTLRQVSAISSVQLLADGSPLGVPGVPGDQPRGSWASFDPSAPPAITAAVYDAGARVRSVGAPVAGLSAAGPLLSPVLSRDGRLIAGLRGFGRRVQLFVGRLGRAPARRFTAVTLTPPTFDDAGDVLTVATGPFGRRLIEAPRAGGIRVVDADPVLLRQPVQQLRVSRDGARIAAVIGATGAARLYVGRVTQTRDGIRVDGMRPVLSGVADVRGVAWADAADLVVTGATAAGPRAVVRVDADGYTGYAPETIDTGTVVGEPTDVAALGSSLVVVAEGVVWQRLGSSWRRVGVGSTPSFAS